MTTNTKLYFVRASFGRHGDAWVDRSPDRMNWDVTIADLASGQWDSPRQVIEVDLVVGTSADVTTNAAIAAAALRRQSDWNEPLPPHLENIC